MKIGELNITNTYVGSTEVSKIYLGTELLWPKEENYVTFTAQEANSTIGLQALSSYQTLEYSTDGSSWDNMTTATTITLANSGDECYIRGILSGNNNNYNNYTRFTMTGKIATSGNCNYLWNYENPDAPLKEYCGYDMFTNCASLATAPELPATTLAYMCYGHMFEGCSNLTTVQELPATALTSSCYSNMFQGCSSLITAPELPATTLADSCYNYMFNNCPSLNYIKCLATDISATDCTSNWVSSVASTGTFVKHPDAASWSTGVNGIPSNWTVVDNTN